MTPAPSLEHDLDRALVDICQLDHENTVLVEQWHEVARAADELDDGANLLDMARRICKENARLRWDAALHEDIADKLAAGQDARDRALDARIAELLAETAALRAEELAARTAMREHRIDRDAARAELRTVRRHLATADWLVEQFHGLTEVHLASMERLGRTIAFLRSSQIPDDALQILTENLTAAAAGTPLESLADDAARNLEQLSKQRDEARGRVSQLIADRREWIALATSLTVQRDGIRTELLRLQAEGGATASELADLAAQVGTSSAGAIELHEAVHKERQGMSRPVTTEGV